MNPLNNAAATALRRARRRLAYAVCQECEAESPRVAARLRRQVRRARQYEAESRWTLEALSMGDA